MAAVGRRLGRQFFERPATEVAPDLLGRVLVRKLPGGSRLSARIVEAEAYEEGDPASHSFRGRTPRNEVMFGRPGLLYVYFTYGMHFCANVVTGTQGEGSAVLLRAAEPLQGRAAMVRRRGTDDVMRLCSGPARLTQSFGLDRGCNGRDLAGQSSVIYLCAGEPVPESRLRTGPRVGISAGSDRAWRFAIDANPYVSKT